MEIHVYIGNKSNGFACKTLGQILVQGVSIIKVEGLKESGKCRENSGKERLIREYVMEWEWFVRK